MLKLICRQFALEAANAAFTVLALAAAISVIVILKGFEQGQYLQLKNMVLNRGSDLIAVQDNVKNFIATRSVIPQLVREKVESVPGVEAVHPLTTLPFIYHSQGKLTPVYLVIFDTSGGPAKLIQGEVKSEGRGIIIDKSLAKKYQLETGDPFMVSDFEFTIAGINNEAAFMMPFAFINYDGMLDLFLESQIAPDLSTFPLLSYLLIDIEKSHSVAEVQAMLELKVEEIDVLTNEQLAINDENLGKGFFEPVIGLLITVGFILALMVIGLLIYANMTRNQRNFSVLRALGFRKQALMIYTFFYIGVLLILALPLSLMIAYSLSQIIEFVVPVYKFAILDPTVLLNVTSLVLLFSLIAAVIPLLMIQKSDPATALKALAGE